MTGAARTLHPLFDATPRLVAPLLAPRHAAVFEAASAYAAGLEARFPHARTDDDARRQARALVADLGAAGLLRHGFPAAHGGGEHGPDARAVALVREQLAAVSPLADALYALQCLGSAPLVAAATGPGADPASDPDAAALAARWLPRIAAGHAIAAFAMTEPEAGSDVASLATTARRDGDAYVLDGRKTLISNAGIADLYTVFARTGPGEGARGISCFVVDAATPGVRFVRPLVTADPHPLGELAFEGARVPADCRLGAEGAGLKAGLRALDRLRPTVGAAACGMAAGALSAAAARTRSRRQFGRPLADLDIVKFKLAGLAMELAAARLLVYRAAAEADADGPDVTATAAVAKCVATEAAQRIVDGAVQLSGGAGVVEGGAVERFYRAVRALRIYEGTTEVQHLVVAARLFDAP